MRKWRLREGALKAHGNKLQSRTGTQCWGCLGPASPILGERRRLEEREEEEAVALSSVRLQRHLQE